MARETYAEKVDRRYRRALCFLAALAGVLVGSLVGLLRRLLSY